MLMQNSLDFSKTIGGNVARFVKEAIPYSNWGMTYFNIRLMELALIELAAGRSNNARRQPGS